MKKILILLLLSTVILSSCTDDQILDRKERRVTGTWKIDRATFREDWSLFNDNVIGFYQDDQITFYDDYSAVYNDNSLQALFEGDWGLILERDADDDRFTYIDMRFFDTVNEEEFTYFAEITFLTHRKMKMTVITDDGRYRFKLIKQ